jgi:hypothetical protein
MNALPPSSGFKSKPSKLLVCFAWVVYSSTLKMEAIYSPERIVIIYHTAWNNIQNPSIFTTMRVSNLTRSLVISTYHHTVEYLKIHDFLQCNFL